MVDGVKGDSQIANLYNYKYERLFNSVKDVESEAELLKRNIHSEAETICDKSETCRESKCEHCHIISSADVSIAIKKLKSDKVNDNGLVYFNNFKHGTELLFQYLSILFTSIMVHHGFCPPTFICAIIISIPKCSKANLSDSDNYRSN